MLLYKEQVIILIIICSYAIIQLLKNRNVSLNMRKIDKEELHDIFKGISENNENYFNKLYEKYNMLIYGIAFSILKNRENSEEVVQKVFIKIWEMEKEKLPRSSEATWLYTLTKNETLNFLKNLKLEENIRTYIT